MRAKFINEIFTDTSDPVSDMGIGHPLYNLKPGIILKPKKDFFVGPRTNFSSAGKKIWKNSFIVVLHFEKTQLDKRKIKVWYYQAWDIKQAKIVTDNIELYTKEFGNSMTGTLKQFENRFTIVPSSIYEAFSEEETDPVRDMGIGIIGVREFKTVKEAAKTFVDHINILSNGAIKSAQELSEIDNDINLGMYNKGAQSPLVQCKRYLDGNYLHQAPLTIRELGGRFDRVTQRVQFLKDFKQEVIEYTRSKFKPKNRFSVYEKFTEQSDPIKDMKIGMDHYIYNIRKHKDGSYNFNTNYEKIAKYIKKCIPAISKNEIERFITFTLSEIYDNIDGDYFELNDLDRLDKQIELAIKQESGSWMGMHSDIAMETMRRRSR